MDGHTDGWKDGHLYSNARAHQDDSRLNSRKSFTWSVVASASVVSVSLVVIGQCSGPVEDNDL